MKKIWLIVLSIFGVSVLGNLGFLDWQYYSKSESESKRNEVTSQFVSEIGMEDVSNSIATDSCGLICQQTIKDKIDEELGKLPSLAGQSSVSPIVPQSKTPTTVNQPKIAYVPLVSSGSVSSLDWTDIIPSEFYFDLNDYPNAKEVRFEAFLQSSNGDSVSARVYDQTNKRGADFSELQSSNSTFTRIQSSAIKIWRGNNKYTVQLKSVNGTGVFLKEAKLIIIF